MAGGKKIKALKGRALVKHLRQELRRANKTIKYLRIEKSGEHWASLRLECYRELGYALLYMDYLHPCDGAHLGQDWWRDQRPRVQALCREAAKSKSVSVITSARFWKKFLKRIHEEIENMC